MAQNFEQYVNKTDNGDDADKADGSWLSENVWKPAYNSGFVQPWNATANVVNGASNKLGSGDVFDKKKELEYAQADVTTFAGVTQNTVSALASIAPYLVAAELSGGVMRNTGRMLNLEGRGAQFAANRFASSIVGAGVYDGARDLRDGETRLGNAFAGAAAFTIFGLGNKAATTYGKTLSERVAMRTLTGIAGSQTASLIGHGHLSAEASLNGMVMNNLFPLAHEGLGKAADRASTSLGRGLTFDRFVEQNKLQGSPEIPGWLGERNPLVKVRMSENNAPGPRANTIHISEAMVKERTAEIIASTERAGNAKTPEAARRQALAEELASEMADLDVSRAGRSGSLLTNRDIVKATKDGRLSILIERPDADGNLTKVPLSLTEMRDRLGTMSLDVHLSNQFQHPVSEPTDFRVVSPKDSLKRLQTFTVADGGAVELKPGQSILAMTKETIILNDQLGPGRHGEPALGARINLNSSLARHFLENHQTAPTLNNGTRNSIVLEIINNSPTTLTLTPGMKFGSIAFERLSGYPGPVKVPSYMHGQTEPNGLKTLDGELQIKLIATDSPPK